MAEPLREPGILVRTDDGYYAITLDVEKRTVALGNGLEEILSEERWARLVPMPMNIFDADGPPASFHGITRLVGAECLR